MNIILKNGSGEIEEKKSRFICHIFKIKSEEARCYRDKKLQSDFNAPKNPKKIDDMEYIVELAFEEMSIATTGPSSRTFKWRSTLRRKESSTSSPLPTRQSKTVW